MTLAHRAVGDIRRGGFRQLRNYVDMCSSLAKRPQQQDFFAYAQKALQRTDSCYYGLVHNLLDTVDEDRLCTVGVNMGFGGLIYGASEMKKQADADGQDFSWITAARCGDPSLPALVAAAEKKGSFVWVLDATEGDPSDVVSLAKAFPKCAFGVLTAPEALTSDRVDKLAECLNLVVLPLLQSPDLTTDACRAARALKRAMLCAVVLFPAVWRPAALCCCWTGMQILPILTVASLTTLSGAMLCSRGRLSRCSSMPKTNLNAT